MEQYASRHGVLPQREIASARGAQTLLRGLNVIEAVADGEASLGRLAERLELNRSTVHRLASALVERRYLSVSREAGYTLGPKLLELGFRAQRYSPRTPSIWVCSIATRRCIWTRSPVGGVSTFAARWASANR